MKNRRMRHCLVILVALVALPASAALRVCILRGAGGEARYDNRFQQWTDRLTRVLVETCGVSPEQIRAVPADASAPPLTRDSAAAAMAELSGSVQPEDVLLVFMIGHGSMQLAPKFLVTGPDIAADDLRAWMDAIPVARQVLINAASSSAAWIDVLSRPDRILVTSTRSGDQPNATEFMEQLLLVLEEGRGDRNRNGMLTLAELCDAASVATSEWYGREDFIVTENALIDDNGDAQGSRLPFDQSDADQKDGGAATAIVLRSDGAADRADPATRQAYRDAISAVEAWKARKDAVDDAAYWKTLEELLLQAARLNPARFAEAPDNSVPEPPAQPVP